MFRIYTMLAWNFMRNNFDDVLALNTLAQWFVLLLKKVLQLIELA